MICERKILRGWNLLKLQAAALWKSLKRIKRKAETRGKYL